MTAKEAVEKTRDMWQWLAETGEEKQDYFKAIGIPAKEIPLNDCWLCEYTTPKRPHSYQRCKFCPLRDYWTVKPADFKEAIGDSLCEARGTEYWEWAYHGTPETSKENAAKVVKLCDKWLEENK